MMNRSSLARFSRVMLAASVAATLTACAPEVQTRGNLPSQSKIEEVKVGSTTRPQVESLLGTPSTSSLFDGGERWYYIGGHTQQYAYHALEELDRQVIAITFDNNGRVSDMRTLGKDDGVDLTVVDRTTPSAGHKLTLMEQLMGNLGRFNSDNNGGKGVTRQ